MAYILSSAVHQGAVPQGIVEKAMNAVGCNFGSQGGRGQCRRFRDAFRSSMSYRSQRVDLATARAQLLKNARERTGGHYGLEAAYAAAITESKHLTLTDILRAFLSGDPRQDEDLADAEVVSAFGQVTLE